MSEQRLCVLQINTNGAWKTVVDFDIDQVNNGELMEAAEVIAKAAHGDRKPGLRIATADGLAQPLMLWSLAKGWVEWSPR